MRSKTHNQIWLNCLFSSLSVAFFLVFFTSASTVKANTSLEPPKFQLIVIDASTGEPLIGANIYNENYTFTTATDYDGKATIIGLENREEVTFSYVGYNTIKISIYELRRKNGKVEMVRDRLKSRRKRFFGGKKSN